MITGRFFFAAAKILTVAKIKINNNLRELWEVSGQLQDTNKADLYWNAINSKTAELTSSSISDLKKAIDIDFARLKVIAKKQIQYLESEKKRISELSHEEAVKELIKMQKINSRINTIKKSANL